MRLRIAIVIFMLSSFFLAIPHGVGAEQQGASKESSEIISKILALPETVLYPGSKPLSAVVGDRDLRRLLLDNWRVDSPAGRQKLLDLLVLVAQDRTTGRAHYRLNDAEVASALLSALDDQDVRLSMRATNLLSTALDESLVRFYAGEIVRIVKEHANTDAILLLGRTGSIEAVALLKDDKRYAAASQRKVELALAKLGDAEFQAKFIQEFAIRRDPRKKMQLANDLAYIGSRQACRAIAGELRSPEIIRAGASYSIRVFYIDSLSKALPQEKALRKPKEEDIRRNGDSYYDAVEKWAIGALGVSWDKPRPPFYWMMPEPGKPEREE